MGSLLGLPLVDGDHVGRSVPELVQSSYYIKGLSLTPSAVTTVNGDLLLIKKYSSIESYEKIVRMLAEQGSGTVFVIDSPVNVKTASRVAVVGSVSRAIGLGESVEKARAKGLETAKVVAEKLSGYTIFKGRIKSHDLREEKGFLTGNVLVEGIGDHRGRSLKIWVKNENIIAWINNQPIVLPPDLIVLIGEDGYGVVNSEIAIERKVVVVAAPAPEVWRTPKGLEVLGPRHFGFDLDYVPVEKLVANMT